MGKLTDKQKERYKLKAREKRTKVRKHTESDVTCRLCNLAVSAKGMPIHLQNVHIINFNTYVVEHLEDFTRFGWTHCSVCDKVTKGTTCSRTCYKAWKSRPENIIGITPGWNKNLTKETNPIL